MDRSYLIRNNPNVSPEVRDPEAVLSRLGHFWDSHGLSKQVLDPRGPMVDKSMSFSEDSASVPDSRPNMPSRPNAATLDGSHFVIGLEGGLSRREVAGLRRAVLQRGEGGRRSASDEASDDALLEGIDMLSPVEVFRSDTSPGPVRPRGPETLLRTIHGFARNTPALIVPQSGSRSDFWNVYNKHLKERQSGLSDSGIPHRWVRQNVDRLRGTEGYNTGLREFDRSQISQPWSDSPSHVAVHFQNHSGKMMTFDRIDLNTGTWARLNPDEFFPG